ncbi:phosphonate metabolism transcriptional regulator PhnF [Psychromarinibacter halotolerans]|uniref:Phosphonate metabolism transcriptional regulator PhnF n=1 Tax=Psychromarinibacter halotolerans TaxID=1775175 RepID=A0ABV7GP04_9RHOB|nr:phosphonate metabolism transcriptional regulator PhnF [Psychromarinibacter halotolerans]MDF0597933.1 phosphonate metabolism transcriptional regulator PhnF [Psychromarinibacter halotolerans]
MTTKSSRKTPLWQAIAGALKGDIAEGRYREGDKLPTESELAERFGVNRHTVRHALSTLVEDGVIRTRRGAGAFVTARPTDYPLGARVRFNQNLLAAGRTPDRKILQVEESVPASPVVADRLGLAAGEQVCVYRGLSLADGQPVALFESHFPAARFAGIGAALRELRSVTQSLARFGVEDYVRQSTRLSARAADATQALHLGLTEGAPLLYSEGVNVDADDVPVEFGRTWFAGDRITLTLGDES